MEIKVNKIIRFDKGSFKGFASVDIVIGESAITLNSLSIREFTKDGVTKLMVSPASQQNPKDQKYYDIFKVQGQLWWDISNAVLKEYNGSGDNSVPVSQDPDGAPEQTTQQKIAAKNPFFKKK